MKGTTSICLVAALLITSCYRVQVQSGLPPGDTAPDYDARWHSAFLLGLVEPYGPVDLSQLCPQGWATLEEQTDLLTGATSVLTLGVYTPHRVTVLCARPGHDVPAMFGYDTPHERDVTYPARRAGDPPPPPRPQRPLPAEP